MNLFTELVFLHDGVFSKSYDKHSTKNAKTFPLNPTPSVHVMMFNHYLVRGFRLIDTYETLWPKYDI